MGGFGGSFGGGGRGSRSDSCHTTWNAGSTKISNPSKGPDPSWSELGCFSCGQGSRYCPKSRNSGPDSKARNTNAHSKARNSNAHSKARNTSGKASSSPELGFGGGLSSRLGCSWDPCSYDTTGAQANAGSHADTGNHTDARNHANAGSHADSRA